MFTRTWLVVLLGAAISVVVNSACAGFLSGVGLISLCSILFPPFYHKLQVHSSIMIGRDKNGKLKWRDQGVSGSVFLFPNPSFFYLLLPPGSPCPSILLLGLSGRFFLKSAPGGRRWSRNISNYDILTILWKKTNEFFQLLLTLSFVQVEGHKGHFPHHEAGGKNTWNIEYFRIEKNLGRRGKCCWILSTWQLRNIQAGGENVVEYWVLENWEIFRQEGTHKLTLFRFFLALSMDLVRWVR